MKIKVSMFILISLLIFAACTPQNIEIEVIETEYGDLTAIWEASDVGSALVDNRLRIENKTGSTITKVTYSPSADEPDWGSLGSSYNIVPEITASITNGNSYDFSLGNGQQIDTTSNNTIWLKIVCANDKYYVSSFTFDTTNNLDEWWVTLYEKNEY